ncbi:hypothetical protein BDV98DRAFT_499699, partial [Pterulicium gracile]
AVLFKLVAFSLSLAVLPISAYFASSKYLWQGNGTYSALTAILIANGVLIAYVIMSMVEDKAPAATPAVASQTKKVQ